jgi:hypothetical protein
VSVPAQITILLALTADLFDPVPLDKMADAGHAVHEAAAKMPAEICARFETAAKLSDEDRKAIIEIARQALAPFQPKPEAGPAPGQETGTKPEAHATAADKPEPKPAKSPPASAARPGQKAEPKPDVGTKADAPTKPKPDSKADPKPAGGSLPAATAEAKPDAKPKPEAKATEKP